MRCPKCNNNSSFIIDSRENQGGTYTRRVHKCKQCEGRYVTMEFVARSEPSANANLLRELKDRMHLELLQDMVADLQNKLNKEPFEVLSK